MKSIYVFFALVFSIPSLCGEREIDDSKIVIIGTGYVGIVQAAGHANLGNQAIGADIDEEKITMLQQGKSPISEPKVEDIINEHIGSNNLEFIADVESAIRDARVIIICVPTPPTDEGSTDLTYVKDVFGKIRDVLKDQQQHKIIMIKSTVTVGTNAEMVNYLSEEVSDELFTVVSNPEFLREGTAVDDFSNQDRIILGIDSENENYEETIRILSNVFRPWVDKGTELFYCPPKIAEAYKYFRNSWLAVKLAYVNESCSFARLHKISFDRITDLMSKDPVWGKGYNRPGPGYGGSCLGKDTRSLERQFNEVGLDNQMVQAARSVNEITKDKPVEMLKECMQDHSMEGKIIAVLGAAFKAGTDDTRDSPTIRSIELLINANAQVNLYDPEEAARESMAAQFEVSNCESVEDAINGCDAVIILTEWPEFNRLESRVFMNSMDGDKIIIDSRNILRHSVLEELNESGFICKTMGGWYAPPATEKMVAADAS